MRTYWHKAVALLVLLMLAGCLPAPPARPADDDDVTADDDDATTDDDDTTADDDDSGDDDDTTGDDDDSGDDDDTTGDDDDTTGDDDDSGDDDDTTLPIDVDGDGSPAGVDCDDNDAANFPGNIEVCDGGDNDCEGTTWATGEDTDGDSDGVVTCLDCDDADSDNYPGNPEECDGEDNDCDASTVLPGENTDVDGDGAIACLDCDDAEPSALPGNAEVCDGIDNDCVPATFAAGEDTDADGDGAVTCLDCDDADSANFPGNAEVCDGLDNDCDGVVPPGESVCCPSEEFDGPGLCSEWSAGPWSGTLGSGSSWTGGADGGSWALNGGFLEYSSVANCSPGDWCGKEFDVVVSEAGPFSVTGTLDIYASGNAVMYHWWFVAFSAGVNVASVGLADSWSAVGPRVFVGCGGVGNYIGSPLVAGPTYASVDVASISRDVNDTIELTFNGIVQDTCVVSGTVDLVRLVLLENGSHPFPAAGLRTDSLVFGP